MIQLAAFFASLLAVGAAWGQSAPPPLSDPNDFSPTACSEAKVRISDADNCAMWQGSQTGNFTVRSTQYLVNGKADSLQYKMTMSYSGDPRVWMLLVHTLDLPGYIMSYDGVTRGASSWSEMAKAGQDFVRPFTNGSRKCFAFHHRGPVQGSGTRSRTTGWFCDDAKAEGWTAEQMHAVLAAVRFDD